MPVFGWGVELWPQSRKAPQNLWAHPYRSLWRKRARTVNTTGSGNCNASTGGKSLGGVDRNSRSSRLRQELDDHAPHPRLYGRSPYCGLCPCGLRCSCPFTSRPLSRTRRRSRSLQILVMPLEQCPTWDVQGAARFNLGHGGGHDTAPMKCGSQETFHSAWKRRPRRLFATGSF